MFTSWIGPGSVHTTTFHTTYDAWCMKYKQMGMSQNRDARNFVFWLIINWKFRASLFWDIPKSWNSTKSYTIANVNWFYPVEIMIFLGKPCVFFAKKRGLPQNQSEHRPGWVHPPFFQVSLVKKACCKASALVRHLEIHETLGESRGNFKPKIYGNPIGNLWKIGEEVRKTMESCLIWDFWRNGWTCGNR